MKNLFILITALIIFAGCAKNRGVEPLRHNVTKDWMMKQDWLGNNSEREVYLAKVTVVKNSLDGGFVFAGYQSDVKAGYFDFTEDKLMFRSLQGQFKGRETSLNMTPTVFQWPITHHEAQLQTIDGKTTNKEIDDDRKQWFQKNSFKINFSMPDISEEDTFVSGGQCWQPISRRRVDDSVQVEPGYISFVVEVLYKRNCLTAQAYVNGHSNYMVQYRYSFRKVERNSDYMPMSYKGEQDPQMRKFGYFQSVYEEQNPENGLAKNIFFINRWHPNKTHHFYFTKDFPEKYKYIFHDIFAKTNKVFADGNLKIRFELHENSYSEDPALNGKVVREFGDLRYSFVNLVEELDPSAPLGYGPSDANPFTGEIIAANLNVWSGMIKYYLQILKLSAERNPKWFQNPQSGMQWEQDFEKSKWSGSDLYMRMKTLLNNEDPRLWTQGWESRQDLVDFFQHMTKETTYGYPGWNMYASGDTLQPMQVMVDHPIALEGLQVNGKKDVSNGLISTFEMPKEFDVSSLYDFKDVLLNDQKTTFMKPRLINYQPLEDGPLMKSASTLFGNSERMPDAEFLKEFSEAVHQYQENHVHDVSRNVRGHCIMNMQESLAGVERQILSGFTTDEIAANIIYRTSIHEFGHNLSLRHNFYGSVDKKNFLEPSVPVNIAELVTDPATGEIVYGADGKPLQTGKTIPVLDANGQQKMWPTVSSSVMDYMRLQDEFFTTQEWEPYDKAALLFAYSTGKIVEKDKTYLFCTDEHTLANALCNRFDRGTTPSEVMMSLIEAYEDGYYTRNYRFGRPYWNPYSYLSGIVGTMKELKEFLPMWRTAFFEANMREELSKQKVNSHQTEQVVTEISRDIKQAIRLSLAFYQAVLQQTAAEKPYRSEYEPFGGALKRMGVAGDKLAAMFFLAGDDALYYNPNRVMIEASYLTYAGVPEFAPMMDKIVENIVTQRVDMEPWFISLGRQSYALSATNFSNRGDETFIKKMKIKKYEARDLIDYFNYTPSDLLVTDVFAPTVSKDADFAAGKEVGLVRVNSNYYLFSVQESPFAYDIYKNVKTSEEFESSSVEGRLDIQELYYLYSIVSGGIF